MREQPATWEPAIYCSAIVDNPPTEKTRKWRFHWDSHPSNLVLLNSLFSGDPPNCRDGPRIRNFDDRILKSFPLENLSSTGDHARKNLSASGDCDPKASRADNCPFSRRIGCRAGARNRLFRYRLFTEKALHSLHSSQNTQ